ncbi:hypothetical protein [Nocardiopsis halotolerans]|uniref:hypothetical protein n=1 Tax=Nocardiopsis halotolerans TaxID=124252 RepID=UPI00034D9F64|nr:hypothetical protein [Nocardiopsis halotolerans]
MLLLLLCLLASVVFLGPVFLLLRRVGKLAKRGWPWTEVVAPRSLIPLALVVLTSAFALYCYAWLKYSPGLFPDDTCMSNAGSKEYPVFHSGLPLSTVCPSAYGGAVDIVPVWVNPVTTALAVVSVVILTGACVAHLTRRH